MLYLRNYLGSIALSQGGSCLNIRRSPLNSDLIFNYHVPEEERTMQKTLIAMAVGATIAAAPLVAAQAGVKLRGQLEVELVSLDGGNFDTQVEQGDAGGRSRVYIDASKDLGNGLKAFGRYAWKLNPSNGSQFAARDQWVGLKGGFGKVMFGRMPTPYKMNGGVKWDPYTATFLEARRSGGMSGDAFGHNGFVNDIIMYGSPKLAGIKFQAGYIADESAGLNGSFLAGGTGVWGPISAIAAYQNLKQKSFGTVLGGNDIKQVKAGIRYKANGLIAAWQFEDVDRAGSIRVNGHRIIRNAGPAKINWINLGYKFGNTLITGSYGNLSADNNGPDVDYGMIGATYFFAKKVRAYLG